jgi:hypothetical protein
VRAVALDGAGNDADSGWVRERGQVRSLKVIGLRESVSDAGEGAFEGCDSLEAVRSEA